MKKRFDSLASSAPLVALKAIRLRIQGKDFEGDMTGFVKLFCLLFVCGIAVGIAAFFGWILNTLNTLFL